MISELSQTSRTNTFIGLIPSVVKAADAKLPTRYGDFRIAGYRSLTSEEEFVVVYKGELRTGDAVPVRIHSQCLTGDVFHSAKCDCGEQLDLAMKAIADEGRGVIVYQQQEGRGIGIINKIRAYALQDEGADTIEANVRLGLDIDARRYEQCVEILRDLGLSRVKALTNNPDKINAMRSGGIEVVERVATEVEPSKHTQNYLSVKKFQMGHLLSLVTP
ncbi:MAG: GTP cyclohydrolase II [Pyrinomonadaceae bacterium]|nr:GTP cyclohydrolase II [Pyrinomonadaceae bacterium]